MGSSSTGLRPGRLLLLYGGIVLLLFVAVPAGVYFAADPEQLDIERIGARSAGPVRPADRRLHALRDRRAARRSGGRPCGRRQRPVLHLGSDVHGALRRRLSRAPLRLLRPRLFGSARHPVYAGAVRPAARRVAGRAAHHAADRSRRAVVRRLGGHIVRRSPPDRVRSLVYVDPSFRSPLALSALEWMPRLWNYLTAVFEERWWADRQLDDFLLSGAISRLARSIQRAAAVRGFRRARLRPVGQRRRRSGDEAEAGRRASAAGARRSGARRTSVPFEFSVALLQAMPHARLVAVEMAGHLPHWETARHRPSCVDRISARVKPGATTGARRDRCASLYVALTYARDRFADVDAGACGRCRLPARLSDREFWTLMRLSEPNGNFRSDNLLSNEIRFQYVIPALDRGRPSPAASISASAPNRTSPTSRRSGRRSPSSSTSAAATSICT